MAASSGGKGAGPAATNPLLDPNATLSGNALFQAAQALANAQTQGPLTELAKQIATNNAQTANAQHLTGGYFNQLGGLAQQGVTDQQNIGTGLNSTLAGISSAENQQLQGIQQGAYANMAKYAPQGEGGLNAPAMQGLTAELARQQGLAAQNEGAQQIHGAQQGANYSHMAASNLGTFASRGQEMLGQMGTAGQLRNEPLTAKMAALHAQQGALLTTDLGKLRQQEINNQIARGGLGLKQASLAATVANNNTRNQLTANGQKITAQNDNARNQLTANQQQITANYNNGRLQATQRSNDPTVVGSAAWARVQSANAKQGKAGTLTPQQNLAGGKSLGQIINSIQQMQSGGIPSGKLDSKGKPIILVAKPNDKQMQALLGQRYDNNLIEAAFELLGYGSMDQRTATALQKMGYNPTAGWSFRNAPIKITKTYNPNTAPGYGLGGSTQGLVNSLPF